MVYTKVGNSWIGRSETKKQVNIILFKEELIWD